MKRSEKACERDKEWNVTDHASCKKLQVVCLSAVTRWVTSALAHCRCVVHACASHRPGLGPRVCTYVCTDAPCALAHCRVCCVCALRLPLIYHRRGSLSESNIFNPLRLHRQQSLLTMGRRVRSEKSCHVVTDPTPIPRLGADVRPPSVHRPPPSSTVLRRPRTSAVPWSATRARGLSKSGVQSCSLCQARGAVRPVVSPYQVTTLSYQYTALRDDLENFCATGTAAER